VRDIALAWCLLADGTARRFFDEVIPGDIVRVVNSKETVDPGNGYGDWNLPWDRWLAGSALRQALSGRSGG
jgi:hypothetical protein